MINIVSNVIGSLAMFCSSVYIWKSLYNKKINFKDYKFYLIGLLMILLILLNYFYNVAFIRIAFITTVLAIVNKLIFGENNNKTIVSTIMAELILSIADMLYGLIVIYVLRINLKSIPIYYGTLFANISALVVSIIISNIGYTKHIYNKLIELVASVRQRKVIFLSLLLIISLNLLLASIFFKLNTYYLFFINIVLLLVYSYVIIKNLETSSKNAMIKTENVTLMNSLSEYENMLDRQRIDNHENKNQLLIIKNMIKKSDKDVINYIDTIVKDEKEDDEILYTRVKTIPSGGLQGIIYQKMLVMKDNKILFSLDVSRDVRKIGLDSFSMEDNYKLCKVIGVFLDNAIEESLKITDKRIMISLYVDDDELVIEISNKFDGKIDINKIDDEGFTTKGTGHGYGLSLVKKVLSETDKFINERSIKNDIFKQVIKVKYK